MAEPWEAYQDAAAPQPAGPWSAYQTAATSEGAKAPGLVGGLARAFTEGVPIFGPAIRNMSAGLSAGVAPYTDRFLEDESQKLPGATFGERYRQARTLQDAEDKAFTEQHPIAAPAAGAAGAVAGSLVAAEMAPALFGAGGGSLAMNMGKSALGSGALGGADAIVRGEDPVRAAEINAGLGLAGPVVGRAVGRGIEGARSLIRPQAAIPTAEALGDVAEQGYRAVRNLDVEFKPQVISTLATGVEQSLMRDGLRPSLAPKTFALIDELQNPPGGVTANFADVAALRRVLGKVAASPDATERMAASRMIDHLDRFLDNPAAADLLKGNARRATQIYKEANANYAAMKRSDTLAGKVESAEEQAASANSGANVENALRQRIRDILKSPKLRRGYSPEEIVAMQSAVRGTAPQNVLRVVGNLLGGGGGLGAVAAGTAAALAGAGPAAIAVPAAGYGIKKLGNAIMRSRVNALDELIRSRAPAAAAANAARAAAAVARAQRLASAAKVGTLLGRGEVPIFGSLAPNNPSVLMTANQAPTPQVDPEEIRKAIARAIITQRSPAQLSLMKRN